MAPTERAIYLAWLGYYVSTEQFDRTLPGQFHPRAHDEWIPRSDVRHLSNTFARHAREACNLALRGYDHELANTIKSKVEGMSYDTQRELQSYLRKGAA